jgi:hypothetical protein
VELGGDDHWVDMPARMVMMLCRQRRPRSVEDPLVRLLQLFRGQGGGRAWGISHALPGARRKMALVGCPALVARTVGLDAMPVPEDLQ